MLLGIVEYGCGNIASVANVLHGVGLRPQTGSDPATLARRTHEALSMCEGIAYPDETSLDDERDYSPKKMRWNPWQIDGYLVRPRSHAHVPSKRGLGDRLVRAYRALGRSA